jgi:hypothetical protein
VRRPASCIRRSDLETVERSRPTAANNSDWIYPFRSKSCMCSSFWTGVPAEIAQKPGGIGTVTWAS